MYFESFKKVKQKRKKNTFCNICNGIIWLLNVISAIVIADVYWVSAVVAAEFYGGIWSTVSGLRESLLTPGESAAAVFEWPV